MKDPRVSRSLGIEHPILQAGMPWVSNPELVAAVSNAGGLGILHPSAGMAVDGDMLTNLPRKYAQAAKVDQPSLRRMFLSGEPSYGGVDGGCH